MTKAVRYYMPRFIEEKKTETCAFYLHFWLPSHTIFPLVVETSRDNHIFISISLQAVEGFMIRHNSATGGKIMFMHRIKSEFRSKVEEEGKLLPELPAQNALH